MCVNRFTLLRLAVVTSQTALLLLLQAPFLLAVSLLPCLFLFRSWLRVSSGDTGLYDPTKVHVRENLRRSIIQSLAFMGYHLLSFFVFMWQLISIMEPSDEGPNTAVPNPAPV